MPAILIASLEPGEGRTTATAALGACLAGHGRATQLARLRTESGDDAAAEDDARMLALVPGCTSSGRAISEQEGRTLASAAGSGTPLLIETPPGVPGVLAAQLSARVVLVTALGDQQRLGDLAAATAGLGAAALGVVVLRQPERRLAAVRDALQQRGLRCLAVLSEDRALAGPNVRELAEALHASRLSEGADEDEAVEYVMLGPISADPGQPYFLQHGSKAVVNRFDKMDLHLAALATEPDCLILTGGQPPSPYLLDRVAGGDGEVTVLLSPDDTVRALELVDDLYGSTRFSGQRKLARAIELFSEQLGPDELAALLG